MKNLKRIAWTGITIISSAISYFVIKRLRKEEREHRIILGLLKLNKDIKNLMKIEAAEKLKIRFINHPKSKEYNDKTFQWRVRADGVIMVPLYKKSIIPTDKNKQFHYYAHEIGHFKNKDSGHFKKEKLCGRVIDNCLLIELQAEINVIEGLKKIGKKFEKPYWSRNFGYIRDQCKNCLELINKGKCLPGAIAKINKYLNRMDRVSGLESRRIIFPKKK